MKFNLTLPIISLFIFSFLLACNERDDVSLQQEHTHLFNPHLLDLNFELPNKVSINVASSGLTTEEVVDSLAELAHQPVLDGVHNSVDYTIEESEGTVTISNVTYGDGEEDPCDGFTKSSTCDKNVSQAERDECVKDAFDAAWEEYKNCAEIRLDARDGNTIYICSKACS